MSDRKIPDRIASIYLCYLGKDKLTRLAAITYFVTQYDGKKFFEQYSTPNDTILKFLKKLDDRGLEL